jgi:hypothetical protein
MAPPLPAGQEAGLTFICHSVNTFGGNAAERNKIHPSKIAGINHFLG